MSVKKQTKLGTANKLGTASMFVADNTLGTDNTPASDNTPDPDDTPVSGNARGFIPVTKWGDHYDWPPPGGMRHLIFYSKTNGFASAFKRVGRRVLVDADRFWKIVKERGNQS